MKGRTLAALLGGCALAGACYDLDVSAIQPVSGTNYTREEIIADPIKIEHLVAGTFTNFWGAATQESPWTIFGVWGEEFSTSVLNFNSAIWDRVAEPRGQFDNQLASAAANPTAKTPWSLLYEANAAPVDFGGIVRRQNIRIIDPSTGIDNTARLLTFAKWIQGLVHIHLAMIFDSAAIINEDVDLTKPTVQPLHHYMEVRDSGIKYLEEAIQMATDNSFVFPLNEGQWIYNTGFDNTQLRAVSHSYIARALAYTARTPAERAAVNWDLVKQHLALGTTAKFGPRGTPASSNVSFLYRRAATAAPTNATNVLVNGVATNICANTSCSGAGLMRVDTRIVGPGDTTGAYQIWLQKVAGPRFDTVSPIAISSPDKRIQLPGNEVPTVKPAFFKFTSIYPQQTAMDTTVRGKYYVSFYWNSTRARDNFTQYPNTGGGRNAVSNTGLNGMQDDMLLPVEFDLLMAEAHLRSNPPNLVAAAELINRSRVANGELPPVTTAGVPGTYPNCVPVRYDSTCGTLFDAMVYEKRLETYGTSIAFLDARGWGCLLAGTPTQLPIPSTQLDIMKKPLYTFGGQPGQPGTADAPNNCPLLFRPS